MSAKWVRVKAWDNRHLTGPLLPVKLVLRLFSSVYFGIGLLVLVALYGVLASVPIGLLVLGLTYAIYALTLLAVIALVAVVPVWIVLRAMKARGVGVMPRAIAAIVGLPMLVTLASGAWYFALWPLLRYDTHAGTGFRLFANFVERYKSMQLRRLSGVEMSELEFYAWWPLKLILVLFVINMIVTTLRRIEFTLPRLGVLMVHTGIVTLALGSMYYASNKQEGDVLLIAGSLEAGGQTAPGRPETGFYDNTQSAIWITKDPAQGWEQRRLPLIPRYSDYNLLAVPGASLPDFDDRLPAGMTPTPTMLKTAAAHRHRDHGPLSIEVPHEYPRLGREPGFVDDDIRMRIVGYASYAQLETRWVADDRPASVSEPAMSMREVEAVLAGPGQPGEAAPTKTWQLVPESPVHRADALDLMSVEYTRGISASRWLDLQAVLPARARHGLVVEVGSFKGVLAAEADRVVTIGDTGWSVRVKQLSPRPIMPIVTPGYRGAESSVAVLEVTPPSSSGATAFERWVYSRYPELTQDLTLPSGAEQAPNAAPVRTPASGAIRIAYIDASRLSVIFDERSDGSVRALVRLPSAPAVVTEQVKPGDSVQVAPALSLRLGKRLERARRVEVPVVVHPHDRDKDNIGNHKAAAIALEVRAGSGAPETLWLPFTQYLSAGQETMRTLTLSDGRSVTLAFGRVRHEFEPAMSVRLLDFEMTPYPHSSQPRDFKSEVLVSSRWNGVYKDEPAKTSLNEPLLVRTPFVPREDVPRLANLVGWTLSLIAPNQYKFSQSGWDQGGWSETKALVDAGTLERPHARFTILGVGNNPGIYIIAAGAVLMSIGIPYAFYLKPWLIGREKRRLQRLVAQGKLKSRSGPSGDFAGGENGHRQPGEVLAAVRAEVVK
jgi:hypothetical protein